jgi:hypothetical protein
VFNRSIPSGGENVSLMADGANKMNAIQSNSLAIIGAIGSGLIGYFGVFWLATHGYYGLALPVGVLRLVASIFKSKSKSIPIICGLAALTLGQYAECQFAPFVIDGRLRIFPRTCRELLSMLRIVNLL